MLIKATVDTAEARAFVAALKKEMAPEKVDKQVEIAAFKTLTEAVKLTKAAIGLRPDGKRWNIEKPENKWAVEKLQPGARLLVNRNRVMFWLEHGTAGGGTGFIYPVRKKFLFIPLTRAAAGGWHPGLVMQRRVKVERRGRAVFIAAGGGKFRRTKEGLRVGQVKVRPEGGTLVRGDYLLAKKVKGAKPKNIVAKIEPLAAAILEAQLREFVKVAVARAKQAGSDAANPAIANA